MIDVYQYIASQDPRKSQSIIRNFGYKGTSGNVAQDLRDLVNMEGEPAVTEIMAIHPDLEYFSALKSSKIKKQEPLAKDTLAYLNAIGSNNNQQNNSNHASVLAANQMNICLIATALFVSAAILITKK